MLYAVCFFFDAGLWYGTLRMANMAKDNSAFSIGNDSVQSLTTSSQPVTSNNNLKATNS
jgi:hypothetical protein